MLIVNKHCTIFTPLLSRHPPLSGHLRRSWRCPVNRGFIVPSFLDNSQTRFGCSVTILAVLNGVSYLMGLFLTNCQKNGIVRIIPIPTWGHVIFLKRRKRKLNSHMLKHKRNACEYLIFNVFFWKGGRRPLASVDFFGVENISF